MTKWLKWIEFGAVVYVAIFTMVLAILTVIGTLDILPERTAVGLLVSLIVFFFAIEFIFILESWRRFPLRQANRVKISTESTVVLQFRQRGWILLGLFLLVIIVLALAFIAKQLPPDATGYQAFFTAVTAFGAWITGAALAIFTYHQWQLRRTEHNLLFDPQITLTSGGTPMTGLAIHNVVKYPYRVEWTVFIQNTSQLPVLVNYVQVNLMLAAQDKSRQAPLYPIFCHILEPADMKPPFEVTLTSPQRIKLIVEGSNAGDAFDYVCGDSGSRDFELLCKIFGTTLNGPQRSTSAELCSESFYVPQNAGWDTSSAVMT